MNPRSLVAALLLVAMPAARAQVDVSADLELVRDSYNLPGVSGLAMRGGRIVAHGAAGVRRMGWPEALTVDDRINLGSCGKWMTAAVAARLVDKGLIDWDTKVSELFINHAEFNGAFPDAELQDFLAHRSGVQSSTTFLAHHWNALEAETGTLSELRRWVVDTIMKDPPEVDPGIFLYANQGYAVAAVMMELATGKSFGELVQQEVFGPLRMSTARLEIAYSDATPPTAAIGHRMLAGYVSPLPTSVPDADLYLRQRAAYEPSGFVSCTLEEWAKFVHVMMTGDVGDYLSASSWQKLTQAFYGGEGYGLGIDVSSRSWALPGFALSHTGEYWGHYTAIWTAPAQDWITLSFTNCDTENFDDFWATDAVISVLMNYRESEPTGPWLEEPEVVSSSVSEGMFTFEFASMPGVCYAVEKLGPPWETWEPANGVEGEVATSLRTRWTTEITEPVQLFRAGPMPAGSGSGP